MPTGPTAVGGAVGAVVRADVSVFSPRSRCLAMHAATAVLTDHRVI